MPSHPDVIQIRFLALIIATASITGDKVEVCVCGFVECSANDGMRAAVVSLDLVVTPWDSNGHLAIRLASVAENARRDICWQLEYHRAQLVAKKGYSEYLEATSVVVEDLGDAIFQSLQITGLTLLVA